MIMDTSSTETDQSVGIIKQTLISSPVIRKILQCRSSSGEECLVLVRSRSIEVNGRRIELNATVRSADLLPTLTQEDLVLLCLSSGWLLVVKIYFDGAIPLVVSSVPLNTKAYRDYILSEGHEIQTDWLGRMFSLTALQDEFTVFPVQPIPKDEFVAGVSPVQISNRFTVSLPGCTILNSCFLHPLKDASENHVLYVVLYATPNSRLKLTLYEWWNDRPLVAFQEYGTLPLDLSPNDSPLFMVPVSCEESCLVIITEKRAFVVTCHDILSGNIHLSVDCQLDKFPVGYYKEPLTRITEDESKPPDDIFFLSAETGLIYMVHASINELVIEPLVNVRQDLGNNFVLQPYDRRNGEVVKCAVVDSPSLLVTYGGDLSFGGSFITDIMYDEDEEEEATNEGSFSTEARESFDSWCPVNDFQVIQTRSNCFSGLELFACTGQNKSGALNHLSYGLRASIFQEGMRMEGVNRMISVSDTNYDSYMIICFPWSTSVFKITVDEGLGYPELEDVSDECGLQVSDSETLSVGFVSANAVQITNDRIIMSDMRGNFKTEPIDTATLVSLCGEFLAIGSVQSSDGGANTWKITIYKVSGTIDDEVCIEQVGYPVVTEQSVSVLKVVQIGSDVKCLVGVRSPAILKYNVDKESGMVFEKEYNGVFPDQASDSVPNDITCFWSGEEQYYLIGLRNGYCIVANEEGEIKLQLKLGEVPIEFVPFEQQNIVFIKNSQLSVFHCESLEINRVVFDFANFVDISTACPFYAGAESNELTLAVVINKNLQIVRLNPNPQMVSRRFEIGVTPKRMVYIDHLSLFAVAMQASRKRRERGCCQLGFFSSKRLESATADGPLVYGHRNSKGKDGERKVDKLVFAVDETVYSLSEWTVIQKGKQYKYLLVGTGFDNGAKGKIRILRVYRNKETGLVEVVRQYSSETEGPVYAISNLTSSSIVYSTVNLASHESKIHVSVIEEGDNNIFRMNKYSSDPLKGPVIQLSTNEGSIFASTVKNSVFVLRFENEQLNIHHGDGVARATVNHLSIGEEYILVSDKGQLFSGLRRTAPGKVTLETMFVFELPSVIVKTRQNDYRLLWGQERIEARPNTFLACGIGGAFYGFRIVSGEEMRKIRDRIDLEGGLGSNDDDADADSTFENGNPLYPGIRWRENLRTSASVIDGDALLQKFGREPWVMDILN